jgi:hypothetical protein
MTAIHQHTTRMGRWLGRQLWRPHYLAHFCFDEEPVVYPPLAQDDLIFIAETIRIRYFQQRAPEYIFRLWRLAGPLAGQIHLLPATHCEFIDPDLREQLVDLYKLLLEGDEYIVNQIGLYDSGEKLSLDPRAKAMIDVMPWMHLVLEHLGVLLFKERFVSKFSHFGRYADGS